MTDDGREVDDTKVAHLAGQIWETIEAGDSNGPETFQALTNVFALLLTMLDCPHCRELAASELAGAIPGILRGADQVVAEREEAGGEDEPPPKLTLVTH